MGTDIRPELSKKNKYWIERHRYYELKHFCLQYPIWRKAYLSLDSLSKRPDDLFIFSNRISDPTSRCAEAREYYSKRMEMIEKAAREADPDLVAYIVHGVVENCSYESLRARYNIPCSKDTYYDRYRRFFYILNKLRE